jgi:hypothetical protein
MMAYRKNFAVAIKNNGRILREIGEVVKLPFGAEYSVLLKNKDSRKAVATIEIDGEDVLNGNSIIVDANTSVEVKGFMKGTTVKNKFKFIHKTKQISNYRGDRIDDGLVRVEFWFEKEEELRVTPRPRPPVPFGGNIWGGSQNAYYSASNIGASATKGLSGSISCSNTVYDSHQVQDDNGITVKGSETYQGFTYGSTKSLEATSTVITLRLSGVSRKSGKKVKKALSVNARLTCDTCGRKSKSCFKYCNRCGTYLH